MTQQVNQFTDHNSWIPNPGKLLVETHNSPASEALEESTLVHSSGAGHKLSSPHGEWGGVESIWRCDDCYEEFDYDKPEECDSCGGMNFEEVSE